MNGPRRSTLTTRRSVTVIVAAGVLLLVLAVPSGALAAQVNIGELAQRSWGSLHQDFPFYWEPGVALALILLLERRFPARPQSAASPGLCLDLLWTLLEAPLAVIVLAGYLPLLRWVIAHAVGGLRVDLAAHVPFVVLIAVSFVVADFLSWVHHYLKHRVPVLWRFHSVHHSTLDLNPFADGRIHVVEFFVNRTVTVLPFFLLGGDARDGLIGLLLIQLWYARFYHSNIRTNLGPLRHAIVTPQYHRMHHSIEPRDADQNFGNFLTVWDRLFGTMVRDFNRYPETGIHDRSFPHPTGRTPLSLAKTYCAQWAYPFARRTPEPIPQTT